jgi:hypothetical protein
VPVISAIRRLRQELETNPGYTVRPCLRKKEKPALLEISGSGRKWA